MKYLLALIIAVLTAPCSAQVYEPHEVNQDLLDRVEALNQNNNNLCELPKVQMVEKEEDAETDAIRDLFPWKPIISRPILPRPPKEEPQPKPEPTPEPAPEPPSAETPPRKPLLPPMPWNPERPKTPSPEKDVQEAGLVGRLVSWLKANFPILGGSISFLVNLSVFLLFLYVFYMVSEFAKATTNRQNWVAFILREPFSQAKGVIDSFRTKK